MGKSACRSTRWRSHVAQLFCLVALAIPALSQAQLSAPVPLPTFRQAMINGPECLNFPALANRWKECDDAAHGSWLADIRAWRAERRVRVGLDVARYDDPRLKWTQSAYIQPQVMVEDRYLYDPRDGALHGRPPPERLEEAIWRRRCRADLANLPQYGRRRSQSNRHAAQHARPA